MEDRIIGPVLPSQFKKDENETTKDNCSPSDQLYGPVLPPNFQKCEEKSQDKIIGPILPVTWSTNSDDDDSSSDQSETEIGPKPNNKPDVSAVEMIERDFERRAEKMKNKLCGVGENNAVKREEWMTELPTEVAKNFGLGPRTFSRKAPIDTGDRSVWTDTPADKEKKERLRMEGKSVEEDKLPVEKMTVIKHTADVKPQVARESLMEIHKKNLKRKAKEQTKPQERRPFDRDVDLQANRFDKSQRDSLIKRSRELHSRFGSGQSKFL